MDIEQTKEELLRSIVSLPGWAVVEEVIDEYIKQLDRISDIELNKTEDGKLAIEVRARECARQKLEGVLDELRAYRTQVRDKVERRSFK